jgi:pimeloyl-ACP methyl ester carboxylesterase
MARRLVLLPAALLLLAAPLPAQAQSVPVPTTAPVLTQPCGGDSWWAGSTNVCDGSVVYRDYVYDDAGADEGDLGYGRGTQSAYGTLAHPAGDVRYPADRITTADLVQLTLTRVGDAVEVVAELNALYTPDSTVLALAVDSDGDPATGGGDWDGLGVRSAGWDDLHVFGEGDPATNTIRGRFPLPAAAVFRVQAVTLQSSGEVMNIAFRGVDEGAAYRIGYDPASPYPPSGQGAWFEDAQAAALADGDISAFGVDVAVADLRPGVTRLQEVGPGLHERVYTSAHTIEDPKGHPGEGMTYAGVKGRGTGGSTTLFAQVFNFLGKYQPYGVYVPEAPGPYGLQMEWHGSNQGINALINQPGMQADFGDGLGRVLVAPLARGPNGYGSDVSERDLLDVMDDVQRALPIDRERVFSSGYSQGGYITFRMAMLYPDRFAGFTGWVPFTGNDTNGTPLPGTVDVTAGAVGNMVEFTRNTRHVPGAMVFGSADELVQVPSAVAMERSFAATDSPYVWYMHTPADHFTFAVADEWGKEAEYSRDQRLVRNPPRVTYRTDERLGSPEHGIRHDRAYWVSEIRGAQEGFVDTDLLSAGCGGEVPVLEAGQGAGPGPLPAPWVSLSKDVVGTEALPAAQTLTGTLVNVASLRVDPAATCLRDGFSYDITTDVPTVLRVGGREVALAPGQNTGTVGGSAAAPAGGLAPAGPSGDPVGLGRAGGSGTLAATGGTPALAALALLLAGGVLARRRRA